MESGKTYNLTVAMSCVVAKEVKNFRVLEMTEEGIVGLADTGFLRFTYEEIADYEEVHNE